MPVIPFPSGVNPVAVPVRGRLWAWHLRGGFAGTRTACLPSPWFAQLRCRTQPPSHAVRAFYATRRSALRDAGRAWLALSETDRHYCHVVHAADTLAATL